MFVKSPTNSKAVMLGAGALKPSVQNLANRQVIEDYTSTDKGNESITPLDPGKVINFMPIPKKITITVTNGGNVDDLDIPFINNGDFVALPANCTATYSDGFSGKLLTRLMNGLQNGNGLLCYGFNVTGYDADSVKSDAVLNNLNMDIRYYNGRGQSYIPGELELAGSERNTQYKDGLLTVKIMFMLNFLSQMKVTLSGGESCQIVLFTTPIKD